MKKLFVIFIILSGAVKEKPYKIDNDNAVQINSEYNGIVIIESNLITVKAL